MMKMERDDTYRYHSNQDLLENAPRTSRNAAKTAAESAAAANRFAADLFRGEEMEDKSSENGVSGAHQFMAVKIIQGSAS